MSDPISNKASVFCAGKVSIGVEVKVDTREMQSWEPARIEALFSGIALVQRAMAGQFSDELERKENQ